MKHAFWGLLVIAGLPAAARADDQVPIPWANKFFVPKEPPPVVVHDFGTVPWGTTLVHRFPITNIYAVPMQIMKDPEVSCGCVRIVRYTQKLEPRETGYIDIEMDGRRFQGAKAVTIQARFGPKYQSTAILQVRAFGRADVQINPGQVNFGVVALGQKPAQTITIHYTGQQNNWKIDPEIDSASAPGVATDLKLLKTKRGDGITYQLTVSLKPEADAGVMQDQILLKTNDAASPILAIPVTGTVQAPLAVVQGTSVKLDSIQVGQETVRNIMVRGNKPFKILKVDGEGDGLTVKYPPIVNQIQVLTITFRPTQPGQLTRKLVITTDQKETATVTIDGTAESANP